VCAARCQRGLEYACRRLVRPKDQTHLRADAAPEEEAQVEFRGDEPNAFGVAESQGFAEPEGARNCNSDADPRLIPDTEKEELTIPIAVPRRGEEKEEGVTDTEPESVRFSKRFTGRNRVTKRHAVAVCIAISKRTT
jgi:hypothetical protein